MRDKLNSDPKYQLGMVGALLLVGVFFFLHMSGGGGAATPPATAVPVAGAPVATTDPAAAAAAGDPLPVVPAPPLPAAIDRAYASNQTVALLVVKNGGIDDKLVAKSVRGLTEAGVASFIVPVGQIARYAAITQGVNVDRVPALILVRPRNETNGAPSGTVMYGYQSPEAIAQAVRDATYSGPDATYAPD